MHGVLLRFFGTKFARISIMIQRIQTLWLILSFSSLVAVCFLPLYHAKDYYKNETASTGLFCAVGTSRSVTPSQTAPLLADVRAWGPVLGVVLSSLLLLYNIFLYGNRPKQIHMCNLAFLLVGGVLVFIFYSVSSQQVVYESGTYTLLASLFFILLARIFIRRDERLVRSAERVR